MTNNQIIISSEVVPLIESRYGISFHKNKTIIWDEDHDPRVITFLNYLEAYFPKTFNKLLAIEEHEGTISLLFNGQYESLGEKLPFEVDAADDIWQINIRTLHKIQGAYECQAKN